MLFLRPSSSLLIATTLSLLQQTIADDAARPENTTVCGQQVYTIKERKLIFNPNAWNPNDIGFQCISVQDEPPAFDAMWSWSMDSVSVHSYPHVKLVARALPAPLSNITALRLSAKWSMGIGSQPRSQPQLPIDFDGLDAQATTANVAFDLFADPDDKKAVSETEAANEIMVWLGQFGYSYPLGKAVVNVTVGGVDFQLFDGRNQRGIHVLTWVAVKAVPTFSEDISPLLRYLTDNKLVSLDTKIGTVSFGTEAFRSGGNVTFSATDFAMGLEVDGVLSDDYTGKNGGSGGAGGTTTQDKDDAARSLGAPWLTAISVATAAVGIFSVLFI
ncbi:concanavalin A-like lectin/glucanase domain-containing protein [Apodospora peruviana]|uniref:Concanavalin A-like lectin/glucanase domain-containing protein n=1 Tax=Apodospora peruviana TaxID=516989 RepID=A0AAE0ID21_9PEZI|nr:concanavalin A-like lectin/glucanase domain-containing protein [Apodospora peruviana]